MDSVQNTTILSKLKIELLHEFLLYLDAKDIFQTKKIFKLPREIFENDYLWKLKFKTDGRRPLQRHQYSEDYEKYKQTVQCSEKAFYKYFYKVRQNWLTRSWKDALKYIPGDPLADIIHAGERFIVKRHNLYTHDIINSNTNEIICKFQMKKHKSDACKVIFPYLVSYNWYNSETFVWNLEEQRLMWKRRFTRMLTMPVFCANDNTIGTITHGATQLTLIELSSGIIKAHLPHSTVISQARFCNKFVLTTTNFGGQLHVWDLNKQVLIYSKNVTLFLHPYKKFLSGIDEYVITKVRGAFIQVLNLKDCTTKRFETNLNEFISSNMMVLRKSQVIFFDMDNNLKVLDYTTGKCILIKKYETELQQITANSNFVFLKTFNDIRILERESYRELRIFNLDKTINGYEINDAQLCFLQATESKLIFQYSGRCQFTLDFNVLR